MDEVRSGPAGRRYASWASDTSSPSCEDMFASLDSGSWCPSGVVGAAESVCVRVFSVSAASASERVFGVRPEGVVGVKVPVDGGRREGRGLASPIVLVLCRLVGCGEAWWWWVGRCGVMVRFVF